MKRLTGRRILYLFSMTMIIAAMSVFLFAWLSHFRSRSPNVVVATSFVFQEEIPFDCSLIWDERVLKAPGGGTVHYPGGHGPRWVKKGEPLAVIRGSSGKRTLRAPDVGYFIAGLDGREGVWDYLTLWRGEQPIPAPGSVSMISDGTPVSSGQAVGKFVPQPQDLRAVGYLDATQAIIDQIHKGTLDMKEEPLGLPFPVTVRVARDLAWKRKVYLTFSLFPPRFLFSRGKSLILCLAKLDGVILPEAAVVQRNGKRGVFVVEGQISRFRNVSGRPVGKGRFLVTDGVKAGEIVVAKGQKAREGKVQLW